MGTLTHVLISVLRDQFESKYDLVTFLVSDLSALNQTQYTYSVGLVSLFVTLLIILILRSQGGRCYIPTNALRLEPRVSLNIRTHWESLG